MDESWTHVMIDLFPTSSLAGVSDDLFSGLLEHFSSCIYGGILPVTPTSFPCTSAQPCPPGELVETQKELLSPEGWHTDVMAVLRDEFKTNVVRWHGGSYFSSHIWMDGIGLKEESNVQAELTWSVEESNQFGTDEYVRSFSASGQNLV
jgi:alpha-N-arabinofuranosidase